MTRIIPGHFRLAKVVHCGCDPLPRM